MSRAITPSFTRESSAEIVAARFRQGDDTGARPRPARVLAALVTHLHAAILETQPTPAEWREAIAFLTDVGHASDERRQEWVLLSDLLGASALVEMLNTRRPPGATPNTGSGPFYRADMPARPLGADLRLDGQGEPVNVSGKVADLDGDPVPGATVETWQADGQGFYENQQPDRQPEFNLRGVFTADACGGFHYRTAKPAGYGVPSDGPVGRLLAGTGCSMRRPAHLHFLVRAEGFEPLATQIFDGADARIGEDALFGVRPELIGDFQRCEQAGAPIWSLNLRFVLARQKTKRQTP